MRLFSPERAERIIAGYDEWIGVVSQRYGVPAALIKAVLYQEMTQIDQFDVLADVAVQIAPHHIRDSSTGYAQIFGRVGLIAVNYAVDHGLATYESLGIDAKHRLDPDNRHDVFKVWVKLHGDAKANIEIATLNLLVCADEMVGRTDFNDFTDDELKLVLTRYNADVKRVTPYGEQSFAHFKRFCGGA